MKNVRFWLQHRLGGDKFYTDAHYDVTILLVCHILSSKVVDMASNEAVLVKYMNFSRIVVSFQGDVQENDIFLSEQSVVEA